MTENIFETEYQALGRVVVRTIGSDTLLVPVSKCADSGNAVFPINETGLFVWERVAAGKTGADVVAELSAAFDVPKETAQADCEEIVEAFLDHGLLEVASGK